MKRLEWPPSRNSQKYYGFVTRIPEFVKAENKKADDLREYYSTNLREKYQDLPELNGKLSKNKILEILAKYEKEHPEYLKEIPREGQFFGYKEVGKGKIDKYIKFLFVPAVKDVSEEAQLKRGTIISEIVDLILKDHTRAIDDIRKLEESYTKILKDLPILSKLNKDISELLQEFAPGTSAHVDWNLEEFELPLPQTKILVQEEGFATHNP